MNHEGYTTTRGEWQEAWERAEARCAEADRLLRIAYQDVHPEDVPMDVLDWLNAPLSEERA